MGIQFSLFFKEYLNHQNRIEKMKTQQYKQQGSDFEPSLQTSIKDHNSIEFIRLIELRKEYARNQGNSPPYL